MKSRVTQAGVLCVGNEKGWGSGGLCFSAAPQRWSWGLALRCSQDAHPQLRNLLMDPAPHKLLVLAGPCLEETGELLLQTGGFSAHHFLQVLRDKEVSCPLSTILSCALG